MGRSAARLQVYILKNIFLDKRSYKNIFLKYFFFQKTKKTCLVWAKKKRGWKNHFKKLSLLFFNNFTFNANNTHTLATKYAI